MTEGMSGVIVDFIVLLLVVEAFAVLLWRRATGAGPAPLAFVCNLMAGGFLLLALRNALAGAAGVWIALCLIAAFLAHLLDLRMRWRGGERPAPPAPVPSALRAALSPRSFERPVRPAPPARNQE